MSSDSPLVDRRPGLILVLLLLLGLGACNGQEPEVNKTTRASTQLGGTVAFAHHSMWVRQNGTVSGQVKVRDQSEGPYIGDGVELTVGIGASVDGDAVGDSVLLKLSSSVSGDVLGNELTQGDGASIGGSFVSPLSLPLDDITPAMPVFSAGTEDVTVSGQSTQVLAAGDYATVKLKQGTQGSPTVLRLAGTYNLQTLDMGLNTRVECTAACELRIKARLEGEQNGYIGPATGSGLSAGDVVLFVEGIPPSPAELPAMLLRCDEATAARRPTKKLVPPPHLRVRTR